MRDLAEKSISKVSLQQSKSVAIASVARNSQLRPVLSPFPSFLQGAADLFKGQQAYLPL